MGGCQLLSLPSERLPGVSGQLLPPQGAPPGAELDCLQEQYLSVHPSVPALLLLLWLRNTWSSGRGLNAEQVQIEWSRMPPGWCVCVWEGIGRLDTVGAATMTQALPVALALWYGVFTVG